MNFLQLKNVEGRLKALDDFTKTKPFKENTIIKQRHFLQKIEVIGEIQQKQTYKNAKKNFNCDL